MENTTKNTQNSLFDKTFRDSEGKIVIAQPPNLPLIVWVVSSLLALIVPPSQINTALQVIAGGSLFTWAWLELFDGVNYFRRALGLVVLIGLIAFKVSNYNGLIN